MTCTVCGSKRCVRLGRYRPYIDYECDTYDCLDCESRFALHDPQVHERLHAHVGSPYDAQRRFGARIAEAFRRGDIPSLRSELVESPKHRFVIEEVEAIERSQGRRPRLLEVGCSNGYLTAYFIARGFDVLGTDISPTAVAAADRQFGEHFAVYPSGVVDRAPFDVAYHVGTIGCVEAPLRFTRDLLELVTEGGSLVFNAPDVEVCRRRSPLWGSSTPPPDLVTLFPPGIWAAELSDVTEVCVSFAAMTPSHRFQEAWQRVRPGVPPVPEPSRTLFCGSAPYDGETAQLRPAIPKALAVSLASVGRVLPSFRTEFGVHVAMRRR